MPCAGSYLKRRHGRFLMQQYISPPHFHIKFNCRFGNHIHISLNLGITLLLPDKSIIRTLIPFPQVQDLYVHKFHDLYFYCENTLCTKILFPTYSIESSGMRFAISSTHFENYENLFTFFLDIYS
jgi:hypothetical protein